MGSHHRRHASQPREWRTAAQQQRAVEEEWLDAYDDEQAGDHAKLEELGKKLAMHIAAAFPQALTAESLDADVIERERAIAKEKAAESGKPEAVQDKMVEGAIGKYAKENALLSQVFVMDNKTPIAQVVEQAGKDAGAKIELVDYVRFQLGEGIEKEESDFAAEVAAAVKGCSSMLRPERSCLGRCFSG